jgi:hypothetical protein
LNGIFKVVAFKPEIILNSYKMANKGADKKKDLSNAGEYLTALNEALNGSGVVVKPVIVLPSNNKLTLQISLKPPPGKGQEPT